MAEVATKKTPTLSGVGSFFTPNMTIGTKALYMVGAVELVLFLLVWTFGLGVFPSPMEVIKQFPSLMEDGLIGHLLSSLQLSLEAITLSTLIALSLAYTATIPAARPIINVLSALRFLSLVGTGVFFHAFAGSGHGMKLAMLTFGMGVFMLSSMKTEVQQVPLPKLDYVRSLRANPVRVLWEAQVMGTSGKAFDTLIDTAAMAWLMLTAVEGIVRTEGGIGVMLLAENKHYNIAGIIAVQLVFLTAGLVQDFGLRTLKKVLLPHTTK
jgi:NitT/TauT family transport system permease protein